MNKPEAMARHEGQGLEIESLAEIKRHGDELTADQFRSVVGEFIEGRVSDTQMIAFLRALHERGVSRSELKAFTEAMRDSGETLAFPADCRPVVDRHSTGGVGDKAGLILPPLLAALGFRVPTITARGFGILGGTLDKLESVPGYSVSIENSRLVAIVQEIGCAICGPTKPLVPADGLIFALRGRAGLLQSIPLIASSILSKKCAASIEALLLQVRFGPGLLATSEDDALSLARTMIELAENLGMHCTASITELSTPMGRSVGNWLEVKESVGCLSCQGPSDVRSHAVETAGQILMLTGRVSDMERGRAAALEMLSSGEALKKWDLMLQAQGADLEQYRAKLAKDHTAPVVADLKASSHGVVKACRAQVVGEVVRDLGGGRDGPGCEPLNHDVGVDQLAKPGENFSPGSVLGRVHAKTAEAAAAALLRLRDAFDFSDLPIKAPFR